MPNEAPFDPCKQWLGIDAVNLGNPRIVLGISPQETDPRVVVRAAEARLSLLRTISPGPFEMARAALLQRVDEAREKLLAEIAVMPPAPRPAGTGTFAMPAPPSPQASSTGPRPAAPAGLAGVMPPMTPVATPPAVPNPFPPAVPPAVPGGDFGSNFGGDMGTPETIKIRTTVYRKQTPVAGIAMIVLGLAAVAGGLVYYKYNVKQKPRKSAERETALAEQAATEGKADAPKSDALKARRPGAKQRPSRDDEATAEGSVSDRAVSSSPPPSKRKERSRPSRPESEPQQETWEEKLVASMPSPPMGKPKPPADEPAKPAAEEQPEVEEAAKMRADEDRPARPAPQPVVGDGQLDETLAGVLKALRSQDDDAAKRLLAEASGKAKGRDAKQRVAAWQQLAAYYEGFLGYRAKALAAVKSGDEYDVKNQKIVVVEVDDDRFVFRAAGGNKTVSRDKIPDGIVLAIVMQWFDDNPANDLYLGAYHLAKKEPDRPRAREHWERAEAAGADASGLVPLLDDPVFTAEE